MAETAFMTRYRNEFIAGFEQRQSLLRDSVTTESQIDGNVATFLVADSGSAETTTRGVNGMIPARADNLNQPTATLTENHDLVRRTKFNVFASQGNATSIMQQGSMGVVNRKLDSQIITVLNTGTVNTGVAVKASLNLFNKSQVILQNAGVPWDSNITVVGTAAFMAYYTSLPEFSSAQYVSGKPFDSGDPSWKDKPVAYFWKGVTWISHPNLPGKGTNAEKCFMYHKTAVGHAIDTAGIQALAGYNEEQDYSWARTTFYGGAGLLQNAGIVVINHDGSDFVAG